MLFKQTKTSVECGNPISKELSSLGLCPVCLDVVENLAGTLDNDYTEEYYSSNESLFQGDY